MGRKGACSLSSHVDEQLVPSAASRDVGHPVVPVQLLAIDALQVVSMLTAGAPPVAGSVVVIDIIALPAACHVLAPLLEDADRLMHISMFG